MFRETRTSPTLKSGLDFAGWTAPMEHRRHPPFHRRAFTLIELLTVMTILAILATLLLTTLGSVKRKAHEAFCTSNLHQIGLALNLYLDDHEKRPPDLQTLVASKYLGNGNALACPADKSPLTPVTTPVPVDSKTGGPAPSKLEPARPLRVSYLHPLSWPDEDWSRLLREHSQAGVVVCTWHDVRARSRKAPLPELPEGLILRGQLDGVVVRRQVFQPEPVASSEVKRSPDRALSPPPAALDATAGAPIPMMNAFPPWQLFSDHTPEPNPAP